MDQEKKDMLRKIKFFKNVPDEELKLFLEMTEEVEYPAGQTIIHEAEEGKEFYVILSGTVEVTKSLSENPNGEVQHFFGIRTAGDFFGEMALLDEKPRSARITSLTPVRLLVMREKDFNVLLHNHLKLFVAIIKGLSYRLRESNQFTIRDLREKNRQLSDLNAQLERKVKERTAELHRQNVELADLNQRKNEFLGICVHDLRNPITSVRGFLELSRDTGCPEETRQEFLQTATKRCDDILKIVNSLLDISSIEEGHVRLRFDHTNINTVIEQRIEFFKHLAQQKNITIQTKMEADLPDVMADAVRVGEILDNLISNAIKFSNEDTSIQIQTHSDEDTIHVAISDQGQGMSQADLGKAFEPYQRLSARPTHNESSLGLGLAIVKKLVELHGGTVSVRSDGKGQGTTFEFTLPTAD